MLRDLILLLIILLVLLFTSCNTETNEKTVIHSIEVYGLVKGESGELERMNTPIFTEKDLDHIDLDTFKFYFTDDYLKKFEVSNIVSEYNMARVAGLRIFSAESGNGFEFVLDGDIIFLGEYSVGIASSYMPTGYVMYDEVDGIRINFVDFSDIKAEDMRKDPRILDVFNDLGLIK